MFYIGDWDKQKVVSHYIENNDVRKILIIYNPSCKMEYDFPDNIPHEYLAYKDAIMYKNYYRLLQWIDKKTLIISDELLIQENRYALEYNCVNAFLNQTPQRIVFSYLPFINDEKDVMILMDQYNNALYKGEQFEYEIVKNSKMFIKPVHITANFIHIDVDKTDIDEYNKDKEKRFSEIGMKDPDTIPRNLAIHAGNIRAKHIINKINSMSSEFIEDSESTHFSENDKFLCRNLRFKKLNCTTYKEDEINTIIDFPIRRQELISLLTRTRGNIINVTTSDLSIDCWQKKDLEDWINRLENFYAETALS